MIGRKAYDEKNIRRRVYDALNVLMAMGIISKDKKEITWIGLPGGVGQDVNVRWKPSKTPLTPLSSTQG